VEGQFGKPVSGQAVAVAAGAVGAEVVFIAVAQLVGICPSTEGSRLAMLVWLGGWGVISVVVL
jgi:NADPH-dependent curcumin reductase CurA